MGEVSKLRVEPSSYDSGQEHSSFLIIMLFVVNAFARTIGKRLICV